VTRIIIDTNAYARLMRGDREAEEIVERCDSVGFSVIVLAELLSGFQSGRRSKKNIEELEEFLASPGVGIVEIDRAAAERYASLSAAMRRIGRPIPTNDLWIAASAIEHEYAVHSYDAHFCAVPGLRVVTKLSDLSEG
jgi:tRNA(fMet)-specific endonuclease VapC